MEYQDRFVAFIDILGFKDLVNRTLGDNPEIKLDDLVSALDVPKEVNLKGIVLGRVGDIAETQYTLTSFSDCIAVSVQASEKGLMNLLIHLRAISFRLLKLGIMVRGGLTRGHLYHHNNMIIGPALIDAYLLEKDEAKYPRIILSHEVAQTALKYKAPLDSIFKDITCKDDDGFYWIDYFWAFRMVATSDKGFQGAWETIEKNIELFISNERKRIASNAPEMQKINWLEKMFEKARDRSLIDMLNTPYPG